MGLAAVVDDSKVDAFAPHARPPQKCRPITRTYLTGIGGIPFHEMVVPDNQNKITREILDGLLSYMSMLPKCCREKVFINSEGGPPGICDRVWPLTQRVEHVRQAYGAIYEKHRPLPDFGIAIALNVVFVPLVLSAPARLPTCQQHVARMELLLPAWTLAPPAVVPVLAEVHAAGADVGS